MFLDAIASPSTYPGQCSGSVSEWDKVSDQPIISVHKTDDSESGHMLSKKSEIGPILMHIYDKQCEIIEGYKNAISLSS